MRSVLGAWLLLTILPSAEAAPLAPEFVFQRAAPSIVTLYTTDRDGRTLGQGSGVVVQAGFVLTNCHVMKGADAVGVKSRGATLTAELIEVNVRHDLCLLRAALLDAPALTRGNTQELRIGQRVFALGAPLGLDLTFTEGLVSGLRREGGYDIIQTSAPVSPGSSGGALLAEDGSLVGIVSFKLSDAQGRGENLNFAMPVDLLDEFRELPR